MSEHRFRDPAGNEWVATDDPSKEILKTYPKGTKEIPMVPAEDQTPPDEDQKP